MSGNFLTATHGVGAIQTTDTKFNIKLDDTKGYAVVTPSTSTKGWLHYPIPAPPPTTANLQSVHPKFTRTNNASVSGIQVRQGDKSLLNSTGIVVSSTSQNLDRVVTSDGTGLLVSLYLELTPSDSVQISWVGIESSD